MRAPIGHNAVGAVWRVAFPAITNDRMIRYADRRTVDNRNTGFDGFKPVMLFGRRLELPVNCTRSALVSASFIFVAMLSGRLIKLMPNLPKPLLAISLPRCGVQMKTTRLILGFA